MNGEPLRAHSIAEIHLYLMATPCAQCGRGPLKSEELDRAYAPGPDDEATGSVTQPGSQYSCRATCQSCGHRDTVAFVLAEGAVKQDPRSLYPIVNPSDEPSTMIDVGQWIALFRVILERASKESDKIESRRLGYEAALCLEEAIKFYEDDELPPARAVFCETTRAHLRDHPQQFARQRLLDMRAKLPTTATMRRRISRDARAQTRRGRPWWKFWS